MRQDERAIIISKDEDFVDQWLLSNQPAQLIWIRKRETAQTVLLLAWLDPLWPEIVKRLESGEKLIELRAQNLPA